MSNANRLKDALKDYLLTIAEVMRPIPGRRYGSLAEMVLKEGTMFSTEPYTAGEKKVLLETFRQQSDSKAKACFYNAQSLALYTGLQYAEGFVATATIPVAIEHGFNILPSGKVVDVTLRDLGEKETCDAKKLLARAQKNLRHAYIGVPFEKLDIRASWFRNESALMLLTDPVVLKSLMEEGSPRRPSMSGLEDVPLPPNIPRPEMWTPASIVEAVQDGFRFMIPFVLGESLFSQNAYWIGGVQFGASGLTVGPEHTPDIHLLPDGWIQAKTYFRPEMVPEKAWLEPPSENGVVPVHVEIDPDTIDWELLNRGHQIRGSF